MKKAQVYISLPIGKHENSVRSRFDYAVDWFMSNFGVGHKICGPINIGCFDDTGLTVPRNHDWAWYMGEDIKDLLRCTHILMTRGWQDSRGCRLEKAIAEHEGLCVIYTDDAEFELLDDE